MPSHYFALLNIRGMLRKAMAVEECDATGDAKRALARLQKSF
jgi:hypothetical protein